MRRVFCGELRTGRILADVPVQSATWSMVHRDAGDISASVRLRSTQARVLSDLTHHVDPARCYLAVAEEDRILQAGPIWAHSYSQDTGELNIKASGLWSWWDHRRLLPVLKEGQRPQSMSLSYSDLWLGTIAKRIVQAVIAHDGGELPLVLPEDEAGQYSRTYPGYEVASVGERLDELQQVDGGPDIAFQPQFSPDHLSIRWVMRCGTGADPMLHQAGPDHVWDNAAPDATVTGIDVSVDASEMGTRAWCLGEGIDSEVSLSYVTDASQIIAGWPLIEIEESRNSIADQSALDAHARSLLRLSRRPWQTWKFEVPAQRAPALGTYQPGDWATVWIGDHEYLQLGPGYYRTRIVRVSGDLSDRVAIELAPTMDAR